MTTAFPAPDDDLNQLFAALTPDIDRQLRAWLEVEIDMSIFDQLEAEPLNLDIKPEPPPHTLTWQQRLAMLHDIGTESHSTAGTDNDLK